MKEFVSIIVPTYKRFALFLKCIESLSCQDFNKDNYEVIAIHDGLECDYDDNKIKERARQIKNFQFEKITHRGSGQTRNYGIQLSKGYLILMIDDDCRAQNNWVSSFVQYMHNQENIVGVGGTVLSTQPQTFVQKYISFKNLLRKPVRDVDGNIVSLITANSCFRKSALDKAGGFRKEFSRYGGEDLDLSFRCKKFGELGYCENAVVYHNHRKFLGELVKQHIAYGRGAYLACKLNDIDF